jgi:transposase InsO family protein
LVQLRKPVNRSPDLVRYDVQRLKALCPMLGKVKIAQILARAGLHLGAIGEHGSIAVIERLILTLKQSIAWLTLVPLRRRVSLRELRYLTARYNRHRPHMTLGGRTPDEVYHRPRDS